MVKPDPLILPSVTVETPTVGLVESPVVTVSDVPDTLNVGDRVKPKATVKRSDGVTPIPGVAVDFFVIDSLGVSVLGERVLTDENGAATATEYYYVGKPDAGATIQFIIVTRPKVV
jgi:hypothetical protein